MKPVNPALLIDDPIKVIIDDMSNVKDNPAFVNKSGAKGYEVTVLRNAVKQLAADSNIPENQLILGLLYHEVAHIKYNSFDHTSNDPLRHWIDNLIEDTRIEYNMSYDYPYVARYIALVLLATKDKIMGDALEENSEIEQATSHLLQMVKLNTIPDDCEDEFAEFMLPRILLARRSNRTKSARIVDEIWQYLKLLVEDSRQLANKDFNPYVKTEKGEGQEGQGKPEKGEGGEGEAKSEKGEGEGEESEGGTTATEGDARQDKIEKLLEQLGGEGGLEGGRGADEIIDDLIGSNEFIRTAINTNNETVRKVHKAFAEIFTKNQNVATKEGDINLKRMQDAYMNRLTGEDGYDYHIQKRCETAFDCVILRDVSGSVHYIAFEYARIVCVLAKALEELHGVKVGIVDFGNSSKIRKAFNQPLIKSDIKPSSSGGTDLLSGMTRLKEMPFKQKTKICIIVTDGWPNDPEGVATEAKKAFYKDFIWLPILFGDEPSGRHKSLMEDAFGRTEYIKSIEDLHKAVHKLIKEKVFV